MDRPPPAWFAAGGRNAEPMDLQELRTFVAIADAGSFSRASLRLGLAQPTVSRQIQGLEQSLKAQLFYRHGRGIALTDAGKRFYETVVPVLAQLDDVRLDISEHANAPGGVVTFAIPPSIGATIVAPLVSTFRQACPAASLRVLEGFSGRLAEWIEAGEVDLAILYDARRGGTTNVTPLLLEDLFLVRAAGVPAPRSTLATKGLDFSRLALVGAGHGLRRVVDLAVQAEGIPQPTYLEIDSVTALKQLAERGEADTILPFGAVHREVAEGRLSAIQLSSPHMKAKLVMATALNRPISAATRILIDLVREAVCGHVAAGALRGRAYGGATRRRA
ncbi:LysR family transcriptional regulator [Bosea sp. Root381]|uniref:LysR substrate-binding domain-containing protein n=1 Tax=Bosea sp. Root381 TaxID=1736524 RepID=UPI0009EB13A0